ncbi:MAG TPA: hypothetical protein VG710_02920 [Opitutus sp.]|nr:hypothetical protein [Opitutus sp.]
MQLLQSRRQPHRKRWRKIALVAGLVLVGFALWESWRELQPRYLRWKQDRALRQARDFIAKHDATNAQLALDVALKTIPGNPETLRVAADMLEQVGAPQAMRLRRAVVQIEPDSAEDAAKLVLCCLRFRDFNAAKDALSSTPPKISAETPMLRASLAFAIATDNAPVADALFDRLRTLYPDEADLKFAQAILWLRHPKAERRDEARHQLEDLARKNPKMALEINREFAADALRRRDYAEAKRRYQQILGDSGTTFTDRLQKANLDLLVDHQPFEPLFVALAPFAAQNENDAAQFAQWLLVQNRGAEADSWISNLPAAVRDSAALKSAHADAVAQVGDWDRLATLLREGAWGTISPETLRLAFAAHTVDNPNHLALRHETWDMTLNSAAGNLGTLRILQRLSAEWKWDDESERTLWAIAHTFPDQTWADQALFNLYKDRKNTNGMRDVMGALRTTDGTVPRYQHDWALLTLLLEPSSAWNPAKDIMRNLHEGEPDNATYATGYAFALAQSGRGAEALAIVDKMTDADRAYPPRAPYLAFVYGVGKRGPDLEKAASLGDGVTFLPEENYLFTRAREELNRKPEKPEKAAKPDTGDAETASPAGAASSTKG